MWAGWMDGGVVCKRPPCRTQILDLRVGLKTMLVCKRPPRLLPTLSTDARDPDVVTPLPAKPAFSILQDVIKPFLQGSLARTIQIRPVPKTNRAIRISAFHLRDNGPIGNNRMAAQRRPRARAPARNYHGRHRRKQRLKFEKIMLNGPAVLERSPQTSASAHAT